MVNIKEEIIIEIPAKFFWYGLSGLDNIVVDSKDSTVAYMDREGYRFKFKIKND